MPPGGPGGPGQFSGPPPLPPLGLFKSKVGRRVALLNLSGVGAGFFHLRSWVFFGINLAVTIGLLVTAAIMGAADNLLTWAPALLAWVLLTVVIGLFAGRQHERRLLVRGEQPAVKGKPVVLAACLVVVMILSLVGVWQTGEWRLRVADAAHARGDCDTAIDVYGQVESGFQLSMSPSLMNKARAGSEACQMLARAQRDVKSENYDHAIESYSKYFAHDASRWEDTDGSVAQVNFDYAAQLAAEAEELFAEAEDLFEELGGSFDEYMFEWVPADPDEQEQQQVNQDEAKAAFDEAMVAYEGALAAYEFVAEEFSDAPLDADMPTALVDFYNEATADYADENWCVASFKIGFFADEDFSWDAAPELGERIEEEHPDSILNCGWAHLDAGDVEDAEQTVEYLEASYPDHEADDVEDLTKHIGAGYIEQEMDRQTLFGETELDLSPFSTGNGDKVTLKFTNNSPGEMHFMYVGPDAVHGEEFVDACEDCEVYSSPPTGNSCFDDGDVMEIKLDPGKYRLMVTFTDSLFGQPITGNVDLKAGETYENCYFRVEN
ncbi:DUF1109 domain-containing protein [Nocardiopsis valliformis]|uniref:DUF1109 domain-containing protein n=1 Tax=Nocardiopsis valliformis TaxID=239974 RepID=UPI000373F68A|nr:DUF1109 domain-containing protein [Nocardiopsis valliformis]